MIGLMLFCAVLLAAVMQLALRGGPLSHTASPPSLRMSARLLTIAGATLTVAPLLPLMFDGFTARSLLDVFAIVVFLILSLAVMLPSWIWLLAAWRRSGTRATDAFVISVAVSCIALTIVLYRGFLMGDADSQDGIVVQIVALLQLVTTISASVVRRLLGAGSEKQVRAGTTAGHETAGNLP
jgi:hypothetical protein